MIIRRWLLIAVVALAACSAPRGAPARTPGSAPDAKTPDPAPRSSATSGALVAQLDGVTLSVLVEPNLLPRGGDITFTAVLRNGRGSFVDYASSSCAFAGLSVSIPVPWEPTGRTWTGQEGWFKTYLLNHAYGPGGVAAHSPANPILLSTPCDESDFDPILTPGQEERADFSRAVRDVLETYPHVVSVAFSISVDIDLQNERPTAEPGYSGIPPRFFPTYRHLTVEGVLMVDGPPTDLLTAGEAIDLLLENDDFVRWLRDQPAGTCQTANLFLTDRSPPDGATWWLINLYCETDVPRHWVAGWVNAETGETKPLEFCDDPCE